MKSFRFKYLYAMIFSSSAAFTSGCSEKPEEPIVPYVLVYPAETKEYSKEIKAVGQVVSIENVDLIARVEGYLTTRNFMPGDYVKKDQLLFQIQKDQYKAQVESAQAKSMQDQATYDNALREYHRQQIMFAQNATSREALDNATQAMLDAEAQVLASKAQLELQELNLSYTDIFSPFDGRIGMYAYSIGNVVSSSSRPLATVVMMDPIWVEFPVSETKLVELMETHKDVLPNIKTGDYSSLSRFYQVRVQLSNGSWFSGTGEINYIDNKVNPKAGTIQMRAVFQNSEELLVPGGFVTVHIESKQKYPSLVIPQSAVLENQLGSYVYVLDEKTSRIQRKYIKTGPIHNYIEITVTEGLKSGDPVLTQGLMRVRPGIKVNYKFQSNLSTSTDELNDYDARESFETDKPDLINKEDQTDTTKAGLARNTLSLLIL